MTIKEVYEKYKHLDEVIEDDPKVILEDFDASEQMDLIVDMWSVIKNELLKEKS